MLGKALASSGWLHTQLEQPGQTRKGKRKQAELLHSPVILLCPSRGEDRELSSQLTVGFGRHSSPPFRRMYSVYFYKEENQLTLMPWKRVWYAK